jgi:hypothetical protein
MCRGLIFAFIVMCSSCVAQKDFERVKYHPVKGGSTFYLEVPKGYTFKWISGSHDNEYQYTYSDSSMVYVTDVSGGGPNYDNIRKQETFYKLFEAQNANDTLLLQGVDSLGLYWMNKSFGRYSIGYIKASKEKKELFDRSIDTFTKKK